MTCVSEYSNNQMNIWFNKLLNCCRQSQLGFSYWQTACSLKFALMLDLCSAINGISRSTQHFLPIPHLANTCFTKRKSRSAREILQHVFLLHFTACSQWLSNTLSKQNAIVLGKAKDTHVGINVYQLLMHIHISQWESITGGLSVPNDIIALHLRMR